MVDKAPSAVPTSPPRELSDESLETSRLLVEFLHAAYAVRRGSVDSSHAASGTIATEAPDGTTLHPISEHAVRAAIHVYQHGDRTVGQIASGLGISYGWASRVVEELEAAHYVSRLRDAGDRRVVHVKLEPSARVTVERAYHWHGDAVEAALAPLSRTERTAVRGFLRRITDRLNEGRAERS
jgi:DNA-binding MarR family transcriptional regulator